MYPIMLALDDTDSAYPGYLYVPGEPVAPHYDGWSGVECTFCGHPLTHAGSADIATGDDVPQDPTTGRHDGIVSGIYAPWAGAAPAESDYAHLRCVVEGCESGMATLTVGAFDPWALAGASESAHEPRHAGVGA